MQRRQAIGACLGALGALTLGCARSSSPASPPSAVPELPPLVPRNPVSTSTSEPPRAERVTSSAFEELQGFCSGVPSVSPEEFQARRERAQLALRTAGFTALICEPGTSLRYLTGVRWGLSERPLLFVLPAKGEPIWVAPAFEANTLREKIGSAHLELWQEHEQAATSAARVLGEKKAGRVALDPNLRLFVAEALRAQLPARAASAFFEELRMVKTRSDLDRLRRVNEATKAALRVASRHVKVGMVEADFAALIRQAQESAGLENIWVLALFGPNAAFPHGTGNPRALEAGDGILVDTGGSLHGCCSDISRTWVLGDPTPAFSSAWQTVLAAQSAALSRIRPGTACQEVDAAAREVLANAGFGKDYERFTHRLGHGIGMDVHEGPYLVRGNQRVLRPGMTMSNEPGIYIPGVLGIRLEDIVAVTETGAEVFGPRAQSLENPFG